MFQGTTIKQLNCTKTDKVFVKEEEVFDSIDAQHEEKGHHGRIINLKQMGEQ